MVTSLDGSEPSMIPARHPGRRRGAGSDEALATSEALPDCRENLAAAAELFLAERSAALYQGA